MENIRGFKKYIKSYKVFYNSIK